MITLQVNTISDHAHIMSVLLQEVHNGMGNFKFGLDLPEIYEDSEVPNVGKKIVFYFESSDFLEKLMRNDKFFSVLNSYTNYEVKELSPFDEVDEYALLRKVNNNDLSRSSVKNFLRKFKGEIESSTTFEELAKKCNFKKAKDGTRETIFAKYLNMKEKGMSYDDIIEKMFFERKPAPFLKLRSKSMNGMMKIFLTREVKKVNEEIETSFDSFNVYGINRASRDNSSYLPIF
jgi:hypothetical protein